MASNPILKAIGLNFSPNQLETPSGSLIEAKNVIIRRDNVIESVRGFNVFGTSMGTSTDRAKQLLNYKNKIIRHFSNRLQGEDGLNNDGVVSFFDFYQNNVVANITEAQDGLRIKSIEANSNLYFTTSEGIKKISAKSAETLSVSSITQAGGVKALDLEARLNIELGNKSGFLPADSGVAYKIVWGTKDANNNLILGTPSEPATVLNSLLNLMLKDFSNFLLQLDNTTNSNPGNSLLTDTDYFSSLALPLTASSLELSDNLILLAKKLDEDLLYATNAGSGALYNPLQITGASVSAGTTTINFASTTLAPSAYFSEGDNINIPTGFTSNGVLVDAINTNQLITEVNALNIKFVAKGYSSSAPVGVSGTITNISEVGFLGTGQCTITCNNHGLKNNQKITISGSSSVPDINGTYVITYLSENTFSIDLTKNYETLSNSSTSVTLKDATDTVEFASAHNLLNGDSVVFNSITTTTGISTNTRYYVITATTNTIQLASTPSGLPISLTNDGTGTIVKALSENIIAANHGYVANDTVSFSVTSSTNEGVDFSAGTNISLSAAVNLPHGLVVGNKVTFTSSSISNVNINTTYYVVAVTPTTFQISETLNGTPLTLTIGTGTMNRVFTSTVYYVLSSGLAADSFKISTTLGGVPNVISGVGNVSKYLKTNGTAGTWNIVVDGFTSAKIESYEFRALEPPIEQTTTPSTNAELVSVQTYLTSIIQTLQNTITDKMPNIVSDTPSSFGIYSQFLKPIETTTSATVNLQFTIPEEILNYGASSNPYFYQVYRTSVTPAEGAVSIFDPVLFAIIQEYKQVEEKFPTPVDFTKGFVEFEDITPESIAGTGANLYTNERSGEGALQANDVPPFALDINRFKGYTFFSNTKTRQRKTLTIVGVENMYNAYNPSSPYKLTISNGSTTNTYTFIVGSKQITQLVCGLASDITAAPSLNYFEINSANDETEYYIWYKVGTAVDPSITVTSLQNKTGLMVVLNSTDSSTIVAEKTKNVLNSILTDFTATNSTNTLTITNKKDGEAVDASESLPVSFTISTTQQGSGENVALKQVLISSSTSPSIAIEETAKSLIRVINRNSNEVVNGFYISGTSSAPGTFLLEQKSLDNNEFYLLTNNTIIGQSFNPDLSPGLLTITNSAANPTVVTSSSAHNLLNGDKIIITNSNSTPSIDGVYQITYLSPTTFSIPVVVTVAGTTGTFESTSVAEASSNEEQPHRVYYSKFQQSESVPIVNYLDIGATDKAILRIFPLRDSLFVFKEDGLYRISGEVAPFSVSLFDSSCILIAPDSLSVSNNQLYGWSTQGVSTITEAGVSIVSRPIDTEILKRASSQYTNFTTATWGIGYESDNSYTVYTTNEVTDNKGTIGYRYSTLTNSWTTLDRTATCGVINSANDRMYIGAGDINYLEKERKDFTRYDYSNREYVRLISAGALNGTSLILSDVSNITEGDVIVQEQTLTVYEFNLLLKKLDLDPSVPTADFYSTLAASPGDNLRTKIEQLATKLDTFSLEGYSTLIGDYTGSIATASIANPTVITTSLPHNLQTGRIVTISGNTSSDVNGKFSVTVSGNPSKFTIPVDLLFSGTGGTYSTNVSDFQDLKTCYNLIASTLSSDPALAFSDYRTIDNNTTQEAIVLNKNSVTKTLTLNLALDFIVGQITVYKAIPCRFVYSPITMGDVLGLKHLRETTMMFENKAFTKASLSFSTDLLPEEIFVEFNGDGNGIFGHQSFGSGFFGGGSNSAPFRTFVPRQCQRCRYLVLGFNHSIAREKFAVFGATITGEIGISTRGYR